MSRRNLIVVTIDVRSSYVTFVSAKVTKTICHSQNSSYSAYLTLMSQKQYELDFSLPRTAANDDYVYQIIVINSNKFSRLIYELYIPIS